MNKEQYLPRELGLYKGKSVQPRTLANESSLIPLNGVSRVRIPPPPLSFTPFCRANIQVKDKSCRSSSPFDTNFDTNAAPQESAAFAWQRSRVRVSSGPLREVVFSR